MENGDPVSSMGQALEKGPSRQLGPDLVFGRLWQTTGIQQVLTDLLRDSAFEFPVERAIYLTVLHRLFISGSDRAAERRCRDVVVPDGMHSGSTNAAAGSKQHGIKTG